MSLRIVCGLHWVPESVLTVAELIRFDCLRRTGRTGGLASSSTANMGADLGLRKDSDIRNLLLDPDVGYMDDGLP